MKLTFAILTAVSCEFGSGDISQCPNDSWEFNSSRRECVPKATEYKVVCDPKFGLTISVNGGLLFDDKSKIQPTYTGSFIRIGTCGGRIDESDEFDYKISAGWDQCGGTQQLSHDDDKDQIQICFDVSGDIDAVTNPDGLVISRILSFKAQCSFNDHFSVQQQFMADLNQVQGGLVDHEAGTLGSLFHLQFYHENIANDDPILTIGERANFRVEKEVSARVPQGIDYMLHSCKATGPNDNGEIISHQIIDNQCFSQLINANGEADLKAFAYDVFAFGQSDAAMVVDLECDVKLCVDTCQLSARGACPANYYN